MSSLSQALAPSDQVGLAPPHVALTRDGAFIFRAEGLLQLRAAALLSDDVRGHDGHDEHDDDRADHDPYPGVHGSSLLGTDPPITTEG